MPRLPIPGSDDNAWGAILNEFLSVEHNSDGTLSSGGSLAGKADSAHTHAIGDVTDLETTINDIESDLSQRLVVLIYSGGSYPSRPSGVPAGYVEYRGPDEPSDWLTGDTWLEIP